MTIIALGVIGVLLGMLVFLILLLRAVCQAHETIVRLSHTLAIYQAAKKGDMDTARIMAAVKTRPPVREPSVSAGAPEEETETGVTITQR